MTTALAATLRSIAYMTTADADRKQSLGLHFLRDALPIQESNPNMLGAFDLFVVTGNREAALVTDDHTVFFQDFGVYQRKRFGLVG